MGFGSFASNALFRASVGATAYYGAKIGSSPEVHTWTVNAINTNFGTFLPHIPDKLLAAAHYVALHIPSLAALKSALLTAAIPVTLAIPVAHFLNWLCEDRNLPADVRDIIDNSRFLYAVQNPVAFSVEYFERKALQPAPGLPKGEPISLYAHDSSLMNIGNDIGIMQGSLPTMHTTLSNELISMRRHLNERYCVHVPDNSQRGFEKSLHDFAPEFAYRRYTEAQPHPELGVVRKIADALISSKLQNINKPAVLVGGSPMQVAKYPNVVHNHAPFLSGRDKYRHEHAYDALTRSFADSVSCRAAFNHCLHSFPDTTLVLPFSAQDINLRTVVESMVFNKQSDALILMHIPVPFLDERVNHWVDDTLQVRFERRQGKISMYHLGHASAGYVNSAENMMSWAQSVPHVPGYQVLMEEIRSIGSVYVLHLKVVEGHHEEYVTAFKCGEEKFLILPILKPEWKFTKGEDRFYVVPANRFNNVVGFCISAGTAKNAMDVVANKIRGQQAEIKVAGKTILPRWELTTDQFGSTITHAMLRSEILRLDHQCMWRTGHDFIQWWYKTMEGSVWDRFTHYLGFIFSMGNARKTPEMFDRSFLRWLGDKMLAAHWQDGRMQDPYGESGFYRIRHAPRKHISFYPSLDEFTPPKLGPPVNVLRHFNYNQESRTPRDRREEKTRIESCWLLDSSYDEFVEKRGREERVRQKECDVETAEAFNMAYLHTRFNVEDFYGEIIREGNTHGLCNRYFCTSFTHFSFDSETENEGSGVGEEDAAPEAHEDEVEMDKVITESDGTDISAISFGYDSENSTKEKGEQQCTPVENQTGSTEVSDEDSVCNSEGLPNCENPCAFYRASSAYDLERLHCKSKIDFAAKLDFSDHEMSSNCHQNFIGQFSSFEEITRFLDQANNGVIPCPDRGAIELVRFITKRKHRSTDTDLHPLDNISEGTVDSRMIMEDSEEEGLLTKVVNNFWEETAVALEITGGKRRKPSLCLNGIPASAKSTIARKLIKGSRACVVVPTRKLQREWRMEVDSSTEVVTQHKIPEFERYDWMVIDEANLLGKDMLEAWLIIAKSRKVKTIIALGDQFQGITRKQNDAEFGKSPLDAPTVQLRNAFSLPQDALAFFLSINGLPMDGTYQTCSEVKSSIIGIDRQLPVPKEFPRLQLYTRSRIHSEEVKDPHGRLMISVTQSQGTRASQHYFTTGLAEHKAPWFNDMLNVQSVLFTRHTERLYVDMPANIFTRAFPKALIENVPIINGKSLSTLNQERARRPYDLDFVLKPHSRLGDFINSAALPLEHSMAYGDVLTTVNANVDPPQLEEQREVSVLTSIKMAMEVLQPRTQHTSRREYKEQLPFIASAAHGLLSIGELGWGDEPTMRCNIPGTANLGDIQMARDRYNDVRNMLLRQLNEPKPMFITTTDISDAHTMLKLYVRAFMKENFVTHINDNFGYEYLATRTKSFLAAWNDPFFFSQHSMTREEFLKSQMKAKLGLEGDETHGQTVIKNSPEMTNYFAAWARHGYYYMACTDRDDFITDTGFSDKELSRLLKERGIAARLETNGNLQIDLTRQDSTHRPAHVIAYCMFLEMAGVPAEKTEMYLRLRSLMYVKSMAENLIKAVAKWNLGSGDPFTLNANCFMMKCNIAVEYEGIHYCAGMQKGDDFVASNEGWVLSRRGAMRDRLRYVMKVDVNKPVYHAGRFLHEGNLLADPVRAFLRHFGKTYDPGVSDAELHQSFLDRQVNYTTEQETYLKAVLPIFYPLLTPEESVYVVDTILALRSFKVFRSTYKYATVVKDNIFSPPEDCAFLVARKLLPQLDRQQLRKFRNHSDPKALGDLFRQHGIAVSHVDHPGMLLPGFVGVVISDNHCYAVTERTPQKL